VLGVTRLLFSLLGEGETGSPRNRFRARETALVHAEGKVDVSSYEDVEEDA